MSIVLWLTKDHKSNREAEEYCYQRWRKATTEKSELFWLNCSVLYDELNLWKVKEEVV